MYIFVHKLALGGTNQLMVAASGEEKLEAGSQGGRTLTFHSLSFCTFWILDHLLTVATQK